MSSFGDQDTEEHSVVVVDDSEWGDDDGMEDAFGFGLGEKGEDGGFHTRNRPGRPRNVVTDRTNSDFKINVQTAVRLHGFMDGAGSDAATLLVYDFRFLRLKSSVRIKEAVVSFRFSALTDGDDGPTVEEIAPQDNYVIHETTQTETLTRTGEAGVKATAMGAGANIGYTYTKVAEATTHDATVVVGQKLYNDYSEALGAFWALRENSTQQSSVVSYLRVAMLLKRPEEDAGFKCVPTIDVELDFKSSVKRLFGRKDAKDDDIFFSPSEPSFNKLGFPIDDTSRLGDVNLNSIFDSTYQNNFKSAIKTHVKVDSKGVVDAEVQEVRTGLVPAEG